MIKRLAKLRQFRKGMDVEDYLIGELRQNWLALEQALRVPQEEVVEEADIVISPSTIVMMGTNSGALAAGVVPILQFFVLDGSGSVSVANEFVPTENGTYFIEFGFRGSTNNNASATLDALVSAAVVGTCSYSVNVAGVVTQSIGTGIFANLTAASGVSFRMTFVNVASATRFYCKITKAS